MTKIYRLAEADFEKVRQLFAQLDAHLAPQAVIAGVAPGTIYVDDSAEPCAAFLHVQQRFYLAGDPQCSDFNEGLHCLFDDVIFPEAPETGQEAFVLIYVSGWEAAIETVILRDKFPLPDQRHTYIFRDANLKIDWRSLLKPGDAPWWAYWNAARAAVSVGENERALRYLQKVVEGGLQNLEAIRESEHLQGLRKMDAWQDVLASLNVGG